MADFKIPELPSDDELGITKEDRERYDEGPSEGEMSKAELLALLGDEPSKPGAKKPTKGGGENGPRKSSAPAAATVGRRGRRGPVTLFLLLGMAVIATSRAALPRPVPANAPDTAFASGRAMATVVEISREPHPTGSPEHTRVRDRLLDRMRALGLEPEVQTATAVIERGTSARAATVRNLVARIPGSQPTGAVLITAHYDSRELAPGAGDNASGVATVLEAVRALQAGPAPRNDVIVLITDGEELGLLGARAFVNEHAWLRDVSVVLSFEMRGAGGASIMFETADQNGWVVSALAELDPKPFANSLSLEVYERLPNDTDFTPFEEAGKQGLNFAAIGRPNVYHQSTDTPENLSEATLQHHGLRALAALRWFGNADLATVTAPNVVYFSVPLVGLVVYDASWVVPIAGVLLVGMLLLVLFALRRSTRPVGIIAGLAVAGVAGALAWGAGVGLLSWTAPFHPEAGSLSAALYHTEGWYVLALVAVVFAVVVSLHSLAGRWLGSEELLIGALVIPWGIALWLSLAAPLGAMNLQWPVAAALLAGLLLLALRSRATGWSGWLVGVVLALPVIVMLTPVIELLWTTLSISQAPLLAVLVAMALHMCLPSLGFLRQPNAWWAPALAVALGGAAFVVGNVVSRASAERPAPSTLLYAYERGSDSGLWITDANADPVLDSVAVAWASAPAGSSFTATRDFAAFGLPGERPVSDAPVFDAAPPEALILSESTANNLRHLELGVRSRIGAEVLGFQPDARGGARLLRINGQPLTNGLDWVEHWGAPDSLVVLEVTVPAGAPVALHVVEQLLRPEEIVVADVFRRPPELAPDVSAQSDRALFRSSLDALLVPVADSMPPEAF